MSDQSSRLPYIPGKNDLDWRKTGKTWLDALDEAFKRTGIPKQDFTVTKIGIDAISGKEYPVEWRGARGAEVSMDYAHVQDGPDVPHIGWQGSGKGASSGHIFVDFVPAGRPTR